MFATDITRTDMLRLIRILKLFKNIYTLRLKKKKYVRKQYRQTENKLKPRKNVLLNNKR